MNTNEYIAKHPAAKRPSLANEVANNIIDFIQETERKPGDRIPSEFELADIFGVGRGTVREAVKLLVSRNVLEIVPAKGTFVSENMGQIGDPLGLAFVPDKIQLIKDLFDIRLLLERYSARKAAENATAAQIDELKSYLEKIDENIDNNEVCTKHDIEFHKALANSCGNSVMSIVIPIIHSNILYFNSMPFERDWKSVNASHWEIVHAIEARSPELAEAEMIKHLAYSSARINRMAEEK